MRIIAGTYRSRMLKSLKGQALRPTSDRLRETLFNVLGPDVAGSRFLDLFAGTGAIGIEALSRGAVEVAFVEHHAPAAGLIRRNLESLDIRRARQCFAWMHFADWKCLHREEEAKTLNSITFFSIRLMLQPTTMLAC